MLRTLNFRNLGENEGMVKFSVIIPTFREQGYIKTTLLALLKARLYGSLRGMEMEIIVVDSGSDKTEEIAKRLIDKVYRLEERGIAKAKNFGALKSRGEFLIFLDADVIVPTDFLERVSKVFESPEVVGGVCANFPANPSLSEKIFFTVYNLATRFCLWLPATKLKIQARGEFLAVRRRAFFKINGFKENLPCAEDGELSYRLSKTGKIKFMIDMAVFESGRRFQKWGIFGTYKAWFEAWVSLTLCGKTKFAVWKSVR